MSGNKIGSLKNAINKAAEGLNGKDGLNAADQGLLRTMVMEPLDAALKKGGSVADMTKSFNNAVENVPGDRVAAALNTGVQPTLNSDDITKIQNQVVPKALEASFTP